QLCCRLGRVLRRPELRRHPALHAQLRARYDPSDDPVDPAWLGGRLRRLPLALSWRSLDLRRGYPWHFSPPADASLALDHRAARPWPHQHAHGPGDDPHHPRAFLHHAVLSKLLHRHSAGVDTRRPHRWCGFLSHLLAHRAAAFTPDPD